MLTQTLLTVAVFVVLLAMLPMGIRWLQARSAGGSAALASGSRVVSAIAVGPQQRVVTVEVGPPEARTWLVLGVTAQTITCLHNTAPGRSADNTQRFAVDMPRGPIEPA